MLKFRHFLAILGLTMLVLAAPATAIERTSGGDTSRNVGVDVQVETIRTFIKSVTERLTIDLNDELGYRYGSKDCQNETKECRIYFALKKLDGRVAVVNQRLMELLALDPKPLHCPGGICNEQDPNVCAFAKAPIAQTCTSAQRLRWDGTQWSCVAKAIWETGGAAACATSTQAAPANCPPEQLRNCCTNWVCGGSC